MALRVVAGTARGRRLVAPKSDARPTTDRAKEALFSALGADRFADAFVLDLYAGSGALGIEALSRGAAHAVFVDRDRRAEDAIRANLASTGFTERASVARVSVEAFLRRHAPDRPFDVVFVDPPYDLDPDTSSAVFGALGAPGVLDGDAIVVVETRRGGPPPLPDAWRVRWQRTHGDTLLTVATL